MIKESQLEQLQLTEDEQIMYDIVGYDRFLEIIEKLGGRKIWLRKCIHKIICNLAIRSEFNRIITIKDFPVELEKAYRALAYKHKLTDRMIRLIVQG